MPKATQTLIFFFIFLICSLSLTLLFKDFDTDKKADSKITTVGFKYTVKDYKGKIAVFTYGEDLPIYILDCPINSIPQKEISSICNGINIENEADLQKIIEAFD